MNLLLIEDNIRISEFVIKGLEENDYSVELSENGIDARKLISQKEWDLILLDIMLPDIDGIELLQYIRYKKIQTPILVISALSDADDKIRALDYGADDYLTKPFLFRELIAHINALTRRAKLRYKDTSNVLECESLKVDIDRHKVERKGLEINLTFQEYKVLKLLLENKDKVISRIELLESVWGIDYDTNTNVIDVYISYLRSKIELKGQAKLIRTIKGRGYMIQTPEAKL